MPLFNNTVKPVGKPFTGSGIAKEKQSVIVLFASEDQEFWMLVPNFGVSVYALWLEPYEKIDVIFFAQFADLVEAVGEMLRMRK